MKKMKKILAFVMAMAMVLGMSVTSFAETGDSTQKYGYKKDRGIITVKGFEFEKKADEENPSAGVKVYAYPIIKAMYAGNQSYTQPAEDAEDKTPIPNDDGSFSGYSSLYAAIDVTDLKVDAEDKTKLPEVNITEAKLNSVIKTISTTKFLVDMTEDEKAALSSAEKKALEDKAPILMDLTKDDSATEGDTWVYNATKSVPVGAYLIVVKGAESKVYNPMVASVYYTNTDQDGNKLDEGTVDIVGSDTWVKVSDAPTVDKVMDVDGDNVKGNSVNIGDKVNYIVPITNIPNYGGEYPVLNIMDTLSKGLTYNNDIKVYVDYSDGKSDNSELIDGNDGTTGAVVGPQELTKDDDYTVTTGTDKTGITTIAVNFVVTGYGTKNNKVNDYTLNDYPGGTVIITYSATLNDNALINENDNINSVKLNYTKDSKFNSDDVKDEEEKKTYTYTFDIDGAAEGESEEIIKRLTEGILTKTGEKTDTEVEIGSEKIENVLKDAEFTLYTVNPDTFVPNGDDTLDKHIYKNGIKDSNGKYSIFNGVVNSNERGQLPIKGLAAGTYYLKETKAPKDYSLNTHVFTIVIDAQYYEEGDTLPEGCEYGQLKSWTITIDGTTTNTFTVKHDGGTKTVYTNGTDENGNLTDGEIKPVIVPNTKLNSLPSTGGIGTTIFTIGGCVIMIIAAGLFFASRRKSSK